MAKDVVNVNEAKTAIDSAAKFTVNAGNVSIDRANVVKSEIETNHGTLHVIEAVILLK